MFVSHTLQAFIMNSNEGREAILCRRREHSRERRAAESSEKREARLDNGSQALQNAGESVVLLKLLNTISMVPSNLQLDMPSSKC